MPRGKTIRYKARSEARAITTRLTQNVSIECAVMLWDRLNSLPACILPVEFGSRPRFIFAVLIAVQANDCWSAKNLGDHLGTNWQSLSKAINILLEMGYIKPMGKPRFIIPFQKIKIDTGYRITAKGEMFISTIFNSLLD